MTVTEIATPWAPDGANKNFHDLIINTLSSMSGSPRHVVSASDVWLWPSLRPRPGQPGPALCPAPRPLPAATVRESRYGPGIVMGTLN